MQIPCPVCGKTVDLAEHFKASPTCEAEVLRRAEVRKKAYDERLKIEDPERYKLLQKLRGLKPTAGTDPDFDYPPQ